MMELAKAVVTTYLSPRIDTPGFMVGPDSGGIGAARVMPELFNTAAKAYCTLDRTVSRDEYHYGLGAMASLRLTFPTPTRVGRGEFAWGLSERLRDWLSKRIGEHADDTEREARPIVWSANCMKKRVPLMRCLSSEIDMVIDPIDSRKTILRGLREA